MPRLMQRRTIGAAPPGSVTVNQINQLGQSFLAGTLYDPAVAVTKATSALLAMTAFDTTNLRLTFTAPAANAAGLCAVQVRMRTLVTAAASTPQVLLGLLDHTNSDAVKVRQSPIVAGAVGNSSSLAAPLVSTFVITGLTPSQSYTYDAAYGVEVVIASSAIKYGGPNDTTGTNAFGGFAYEIYDEPNLLAAVSYDPGTASVATSVASLLAMTAVDTTNLRVTFTAPASGNVRVRVRGCISGVTAAQSAMLWGVLDGATVRLRARGTGGRNILAGQSGAATDQWVNEATGLVTGLTPGNSYTWDAAYGVENAGTGGVIKIGGPNNATTDDAWGQFAFEVYTA